MSTIKTYLVTGGFGFLGGRMACFLNEAGHEIVLGSRAKRTSPPWCPRAVVRETEWSNERSLAAACAGVDVVIHAAGMDAAACMANPDGALEMNGNGTARLTAAACEAGVKLVIFISTAHVYGAPLHGVITEETLPMNNHPYATSKLAGEKAVMARTGGGATRGVVIRLSNGFGVPASPGTGCGVLVINDLCCQAVTAGQMVLKTDGSQKRDFIAMADVVDCIYRLTEMGGESLASGIFNLGGGWAPTIFNVAQVIQKRCHELFGFCPEIGRPQSVGATPAPALDFRSDALNRLGIVTAGRQMAEIDRLLEYHRDARCP